MKHLLFVSVLLISLSPSPSRANATVRASASVSTVSHGIRITLVMPRREYPQNALVFTDVGVMNLTRHAIQIPIANLDCSAIGVQVMSSHGRVLFPPTFAGSRYIPNCPAHMPGVGLPALGMRTWRIPVILRGPRLQLQMQLPSGNASAMVTPIVPVRLVAGESPPRVVLHKLPHIFAQMAANTGEGGPLHFTDWMSCHGGSMVYGDPWNSRWSRHTGVVFVPGWHRMNGCSGSREWHLLVGYENHPVASFDYKASG